jgi:hypothetical protein
MTDFTIVVGDLCVILCVITAIFCILCAIDSTYNMWKNKKRRIKGGAAQRP